MPLSIKHPLTDIFQLQPRQNLVQQDLDCNHEEGSQSLFNTREYFSLLFRSRALQLDIQTLKK